MDFVLLWRHTLDVFELKLDIPLCFKFHSNLILGSLVWYSVFGVHRVMSVSEMGEHVGVIQQNTAPGNRKKSYVCKWP